MACLHDFTGGERVNPVAVERDKADRVCLGLSVKHALALRAIQHLPIPMLSIDCGERLIGSRMLANRYTHRFPVSLVDTERRESETDILRSLRHTRQNAKTRRAIPCIILLAFVVTFEGKLRTASETVFGKRKNAP